MWTNVDVVLLLLVYGGIGFAFYKDKSDNYRKVYDENRQLQKTARYAVELEAALTNVDPKLADLVKIQYKPEPV